MFDSVSHKPTGARQPAIRNQQSPERSSASPQNSALVARVKTWLVLHSPDHVSQAGQVPLARRIRCHRRCLAKNYSCSSQLSQLSQLSPVHRPGRSWQVLRASTVTRALPGFLCHTTNFTAGQRFLFPARRSTSTSSPPFPSNSLPSFPGLFHHSLPPHTSKQRSFPVSPQSLVPTFLSFSGINHLHQKKQTLSVGDHNICLIE